MPVSSPLRSVPLATMNSIDNSINDTTTEPSPHRAPLIHKGSEHSSASATQTPDKQQHNNNTSAYVASTENPSSAKRPKVDVTALLSCRAASVDQPLPC
jgi:hypothetical protein